MLIRGANAVGYKNYPDNVIRAFINEAAKSGIDIFRIFDSLNWMEGMKISTEEVLKTGKIAEVSMCYTGDILDASKTKYDLDYYLKMATEIEKTGAHILAIKDMSGLLKPGAAHKLITALKQEVKMPIHLHTHDTTGNGVATVLFASMAGADIADAALNGISGLTSQPALNSIVAALKNTPRDTFLKEDELQILSDYWGSTRQVYGKFESELKSGSNTGFLFTFFAVVEKGLHNSICCSKVAQSAASIFLAFSFDIFLRARLSTSLHFSIKFCCLTQLRQTKLVLSLQ
jgi:pyruvate carboxylase